MIESKISEKHTYIILILTLISIASCIILKASLFYGFLSSIVFSSYLFIKSGFSLAKLLNMMKKGLGECKSLFVLMTLISAMISIWMSSGVLPTMLYYGFKYMQDTNFLLASFLLTSIVSVLMGTAFGTISSVGIALIGLSKIFGVPAHILLGAIVSGSFVADKISPLSNLFILTLQTVKISYKESLMPMLKTLIPTYLVSILLYYFIGEKYTLSPIASNIDNLMSSIDSNFVVSPLLLLLPLSIIIMSLLGIKIVKAVSLALGAGIIASFTLQKVSFNDILTALFTGYKINTNSADLNAILVSGGMVSMVSILLIITGAISLSSMFQETGLLIPIIEKITSKINSKEELILKTGLISTSLTAISDQSVGVIIPGKLLRNKYRELGIENTILARTITDTCGVIAPLIPWNVNSLFILTATGIPTMTYAPYAVLCYLLPMLTFIFPYVDKLKSKKVVSHSNAKINGGEC